MVWIMLFKVGELIEGCLFGDEELITNEPRKYTARAV